MPLIAWRNEAILNYSKVATIADGQTASGAVNMEGLTPVGVFAPAGLAGTALSFKAALTLTGTYGDVLKEDGSVYSVTVAAGKYTMLDPTQFAGLRFLKVVSGSTETGGKAVTLAGRVV